MYDLWKGNESSELMFLVPLVAGVNMVMLHDGINQLGLLDIESARMVRKLLPTDEDVIFVRIANEHYEYEDIFNNEHTLFVRGVCRVNERLARKYAAELIRN